jgi:exonuclease SbcD
VTRLLHLADLHMGSLKHSHRDAETGLPSSIVSTTRCLRAAVDAAIDRRVDLVVFVGDTFDRADPVIEAKNLFDAELRRLRPAGIPVLMVSGNHDYADDPLKSIVTNYAGYPGVTVVQDSRTVEVAGIRVACLPWVSRRRIMALHPELSRTEADEAIEEALGALVHARRAESPDIAAAHWSLAEGSYDNERSPIPGADPWLRLADLEGLGRFVALGHFHRPQEFRVGDTTVAYSGSLDRLSFGEERQDKVALEVDVATGEILDRIPLPARRFLTLDYVETPDGPDYTGDDSEDVEGAVVRLRNFPRERASAHMRHLAERGAAEISFVTPPPAEAVMRSREVAEADDPMAALEALWNLENTPEAQRVPLRAMAAAIFEETRA